MGRESWVGSTIRRPLRSANRSTPNDTSGIRAAPSPVVGSRWEVFLGGWVRPRGHSDRLQVHFTRFRFFRQCHPPATFLRWLNADAEPKPREKPTEQKPDRPKTPDEVCDLIVGIAKEAGWGTTRILGELRKLGIRSSSTAHRTPCVGERGCDRPAYFRRFRIFTGWIAEIMESFIKAHLWKLWNVRQSDIMEPVR